MDLNIIHKTIKLLENNIRGNLQNLDKAESLDLTPNAQFLKIKINKFDFIKMKHFRSVKYFRDWGGTAGCWFQPCPAHLAQS